MPNKRKMAKLQIKQLSKGKLNSNKNVQETLRLIKEKAELDKEDIDYDFENIKNNDFEKLADNDDDTRKLKSTKPKKPRPEKRKQPEQHQTVPTAKKQKVESSTNGQNIIPKKSKKNKYFFIAHPEALDKKEKLIKNDEENSKFVIDQEKIKLNELKKKKKEKLDKNNIKNGTDSKNNKNKNENTKIWSFEECKSSDEEKEDEKTKKKKKLKTKGNALDITDIDKSFKLKKKIEVLPNGSKVEILVPEYVQIDDLEESESEDDKDNEDEELNEEEDEEASEVEEDTNKKETNKKKETNSAKDKLQASRFRYLNEMLYRQVSSDSFEYFKK